MLRAVLLLILSTSFISSNSQTVSAEASKDYVGKTVTVGGKVVDGRYLVSSSRQPTLLNLDKAFPDQIFSIVIYGDNRKLFGYKPEEALLNKNILVSGKIELYNGKPQIIVTSPEQIVIATVGTSAVSSEVSLKGGGMGDTQIKLGVKLKAGPGNDFKTLAKLKAGSIIHVLHTDNGWAYVSVKRSVGKSDKDYTLNGFIKSEELK